MSQMSKLVVLVVASLPVLEAMHGSASADEAQLVAEGATVTSLADGFVFTEGPACHASGDVYFSDIPNARIHRWSTEGQLTTFRENSGGANGLYFDRDGNLLCCEGKARRLTSASPAGDVAVLADEYDGKKLNSPNDLWIDPQGGVYFNQPRYGSMDDLAQGGFYVFYLSPDRATVTRVIDNLVKPNGVIGTSDGKLLYVADPGDEKMYVYRINSDGSLTDRKLFAAEGSDGMTLDEEGNLYLTGEAVNVYNPAGELISTIATPERPSNVVFGGKDRMTLFITARRGFYSLRMSVRGQ